MDTESKVIELLGDDLHGERVVCAAVATTHRWYRFLTRFPAASRPWYLALTDTRLFILSAEAQGRNWRAARNVEARRSDVEVERLILGWLVLNVRTEGRWSLHALDWIPGLGSNSRRAKQIADALGEQSRSQR